MNQPVKASKQSGFTIIELTLAMAFLAMIFMFISVVTMQMMSVYNRGLAIKQINQVGSSIMDDIARATNSGAADTLATGDGFLCVGDVGYFWNSQQRLSSGDPVYYYDNNGDSNYDPADDQAVGVVKTNTDVGSSSVSCGSISSDEAVVPDDVSDMVGDNVRVIDVNVTSPSTPNAANLAQISLTIGTYTDDGDNTPVNDGGGWYCEPGSLGNFCAVETYNTVVYLPN